LVQSQIGHAFEHRQEPPLDLAPKDLLLAILVRHMWRATCALICGVFGYVAKAAKPAVLPGQRNFSRHITFYQRRP
jgi:hypothetical protein